MLHDARTLVITQYRWFGAAPGVPLPPLGERIGKHSKANALGIKSARPAIRRLAKNRFEPVGDVSLLVDRLFGAREQMLGSISLSA